MRGSLMLLVIVLASVSASQIFNRELNGHWDAFKKEHGKIYGEEEEVLRRLIWERNLKFIEKHNQEADNGLHTYKVGSNKFCDMTNEEYRKQLNGLKPRRVNNLKSSLYVPINTDIPDSIDWRAKGAVTKKINDQGQCGSCWAFSALGSLEGQHFRKTGKLIALSAQNLMDCSGDFGNMGCNGGWMDQAFNYIKSNNGIDSEESYPYEAQDGTCRFNRTNVIATDTGFVDIPKGSEIALTNALANIGPIAVANDASHIGFQLYKSGVYYDPNCSSENVDHSPLAVGYGKDKKSGLDYYIVKNSWGESWGNHGYILMARNKNNNCGLATVASYPTV